MHDTILGRRNAQAKSKGEFTLHGAGQLKDSHGMQLSGSNHFRRPLFTFCLFRVHGGVRYKRITLHDAAARACDNSHLAAPNVLLAAPWAIHPDASRREHAFIVQVARMRLHHDDHMNLFATTTKGEKDPMAVYNQGPCTPATTEQCILHFSPATTQRLLQKADLMTTNQKRHGCTTFTIPDPRSCHQHQQPTRKLSFGTPPSISKKRPLALQGFFTA